MPARSPGQQQPQRGPLSEMAIDQGRQPLPCLFSNLAIEHQFRKWPESRHTPGQYAGISKREMLPGMFENGRGNKDSISCKKHGFQAPMHTSETKQTVCKMLAGMFENNRGDKDSISCKSTDFKSPSIRNQSDGVTPTDSSMHPLG